MNKQENEYIVTRIEKYNENIVEEIFKQVAFTVWIIAAIIALTINPKFDDINMADKIFMDTKFIICSLVIGTCFENLFKSIFKVYKLKSKKKKLLNLKEKIAKLDTLKLEDSNKINKLRY